ncbi:MAG: efflux RND transporter periplasmic adaptor subunit [Polyangiaceae bacterium]
MNLKTGISVLAATLTLVAACSKSKTEPAEKAPETKPAASAHAEHSDEPEHAGLPKQVRLTPEVIKDANVRWSPVGKESLTATLTLPGEVVADPDKTGRISSPVAGRIESVSFSEGTTVKKGDVVAVLRVPDLGKIRGAQVAAASKARAAKTNADRLKSLVDQRLASNQAYLDAQAESESFDAEAKALGEQLGALGAGSVSGSAFLLTLRAPASGVVVHREAVVGQPVSSDQVLGVVADLTDVWFLGRVFEKDLGRLHVGANASVQLNAFSNETFDGTINYLGQQVDPVARTVTARIVIRNRGGLLRLGLFGSARVSAGDSDGGTPTLVIPRTAITEVAGKNVVFVRHSDGDFELHEIVIGTSAFGRVEVASGLREGEEVVTSGAYTLKSAVLKSTIAEEE